MNEHIVFESTTIEEPFQEVQSVNDDKTRIYTPSWSRRKLLKTGAVAGAAGLAARRHDHDSRLTGPDRGDGSSGRAGGALLRVGRHER